VPPPATGEPSPRTARAEEPVRVPGFGSTTVTPGPAGSDRDPIGRLINATPPAAAPPASPAAAAPASAGPAATLPPAAANASSAKELYETAHGYLLQQDYGAAEAAFEEFLRRHPGDRLAADAQYWLGEALYVQRRYRPAGQAFLRVVEKHPQSNKVPNSILKLAQSLDQLGQKDCALFEELETRHPGAPADVKTRARALKQRVGC
jgi:tol-pal system protein YbgF